MKIICAIAVLLSCINVALSVVGPICEFDATNSICILSNAYHPTGLPDLADLTPGHEVAKKVRISYTTDLVLRFVFNKFTLMTELEVTGGSITNLVGTSGSETLRNSGTTGSTGSVATVEKIQIKNNKLVKLDANAFINTVALKHLDLSYNQIATFDLNFDTSLNNLKSLNLAFNKIATLFTSAPVLTQLESLNVTGNLLTAATIPIPTAAPLKQVDFSRNLISTVTKDQFKDFVNLVEIQLGGNKFTTLDAEVFTALVNLKVLDVSGNALTSWDFLIKAKTLELLNMQNTGITKLEDKTLEALTALRYLNISSNKFTQLHTSWFIKNIKLEVLDASANRIEMVGSDLFDLMTGFRAANFTCNKCLSQTLSKKPTASDLELCSSATSIIISTALTFASIALIKFL